MKRSMLLFVAIIFSVIHFQNAYGIELTLFDKDYIRGKGKPDVWHEHFIAHEMKSILTVSTGSRAEKNIISSCEISLNGQNIVDQSDFKRNENKLIFSVYLAKQNDISIKLMSKPGSFINILITQELDADAAMIITPEGGMLDVSDQNNDIAGTKIFFPSETIDESFILETELSEINQELPIDMTQISFALNIEPEGISFNKEVNITLPYSDSDNDGIIDETGIREEDIFGITYNEETQEWEQLNTISQDTDNNTFTFGTYHFSNYLLAGIEPNIKGYHEAANSLSTWGWACNPADYDEPVWIHFYKEDGAYMGATLADDFREEAVGNKCGGFRNHGFDWDYPESLKDGKTHQIYAYAINSKGEYNPLLTGSPISIYIPPTNINISPKGLHETADSFSTKGWVCDPDDYKSPLWIHFYNENGMFIGETLANVNREQAVGNECGGYTNHGFNWIYPDSMKDGQTHKIYAHAINIGGEPNPLLAGSPKIAYIPFEKPEPNAITYFYTPEYISDINNRVYANMDCPEIKDQTAICVWRLGDNAVNQDIHWAIGDFTAFYPNPANGLTQKGINNNWYGSTSFQMLGTAMGVHIHTWSSGEDIPKNLANGQVYYLWSNNHQKPWTHNDSVFVMKYDLKVPNCYMESNSIGYIYASILLKDNNNKGLWLQVHNFDTRNLFVEQTGFDGGDTGTNLPYFNSYFGKTTNYVTMGAGSSSSTDTTFQEWKYYEFRVSAKQIDAIIKKTNAEHGTSLSNNIADYSMALMSIQAEIHRPLSPIQHGHMSMSIRDIYLLEEYDFN